MDLDLSSSFSRSLGWVTAEEAEKLRLSTVVIAGSGGVGGQYAETLARLGVGRFRLADPDRFEPANFNRQNGSGVSTVGKLKVEVIRDRILDINPSAQVEIFPEGVVSESMDQFLDGASLYLDGLDFFAIDIRVELFRRLREKGIVGVTIAPLGMGAAWLVFRPGSMTFDDYFGLSNATDPVKRSARFLTGLAPKLLHGSYLVDPSRVNIPAQKVPSTPMGCVLCAGVAGALVVKLLLNRGVIHHAPWSYQFDAYRQVLKHAYVPGGYRNPLQRLKVSILISRLRRSQGAT